MIFAASGGRIEEYCDLRRLFFNAVRYRDIPQATAAKLLTMRRHAYMAVLIASPKNEMPLERQLAPARDQRIDQVCCRRPP